VGRKYDKYVSESVTIPDVTGLYYIFFDSTGALGFDTDFFDWANETPTAYVYWNSATQKAEFFADERHGITMDWQTHEYLHRTRGAAIANGFDATFTLGIGSLDIHAQINIDNGTFFDEDLQVDIRNSLIPDENTWDQQLQGPARIPVFYKVGTGWRYDAPTDFPVKQGTTHPMYNRTSDWTVQELGANTYGIQWIVATNQLNYPVLSIMGQAQYANVGQAEAASWDSMNLDGLPIVEIRVLYKIIFRATGTNTPGCRFVEVDDYRNALASATSTAAAVVDHGNLTGLADDDHPQYLLNSSTTNFPTSLDTGLPDSIEALQAKVGVDGSAVTTSLDYRVGSIEANGYRLMYRSKYESTTTGITVPSGTKAAMITVVGGGGGGGGATTTGSGQASGGNGGLSGLVVVDFLESTNALYPNAIVVAGDTWNVIVGAGGTGFAGGQGNFGGASYVVRGSSQTLVYAEGGFGGFVNSASAAIVRSMHNDQSFYGTGTIYSNVGFRMGRIPGSAPFNISGTAASSGSGGSNAFGHGGPNRGTTGNGLAPSTDPRGYGGGGGGALNLQSQTITRSGGTGSSGLVIIDWYAR
jgi:hypothetical protein